MRILLIMQCAVGDVILCHSMVQLLLQRYPGSIVDIVVDPSVMALIPYCPGINQAYPLPIGRYSISVRQRIQQQHKLGKALQAYEYTRAYVGWLRSSQSWLPTFARIPHRIGWKWSFRPILLNDQRPWDRRKVRRLVDFFCALVLTPEELRAQDQAFSFPRPKLLLPSLRSTEILERVGLSPSRPYLVLAPGSSVGSSYRRWPIPYFTALLQKAAQLPYPFVIVGAPHERPRAEKILHHLPPSLRKESIIDLVGKTTLDEVLHIVASSALTVTNDSGLQHVAEATDTPVVAMHSGNTCFSAAPIGHRSICMRADPFDLLYDKAPILPNTRETMSAILPEGVFAAIQTALAIYPPGSPRWIEPYPKYI